VEDIRDIADRVRQALAARNVRVLDAYFTLDPAVTLDAETTTVDELVDVIAESFTPFASVNVTRLERDELDAAVEANGDLLRAEAIAIFNEHIGDADTVGVYWLHGAVPLSYFAAAPWRFRLNQLLEVSELDHRLQIDAERDKEDARLTHLIDQLEANPDFRGASINTRRAVGTNLVESLLDVQDEGLRYRVVARASIKAQDNATSTYMRLRGQFPELAAELVETEMWRTSNRRVADRDNAARQFLVSKADGYGPTIQDVTTLRVTADGIVGRR